MAAGESAESRSRTRQSATPLQPSPSWCVSARSTCASERSAKLPKRSSPPRRPEKGISKAGGQQSARGRAVAAGSHRW
eukprot:1281625-Pleurochrysis_carterae.AAC.2